MLGTASRASCASGFHKPARLMALPQCNRTSPTCATVAVFGTRSLSLNSASRSPSVTPLPPQVPAKLQAARSWSCRSRASPSAFDAIAVAVREHEFHPRAGPRIRSSANVSDERTWHRFPSIVAADQNVTFARSPCVPSGFPVSEMLAPIRFAIDAVIASPRPEPISPLPSTR